MTRSTSRLLEEYRHRNGMPSEAQAPAAMISQAILEFEYPRANWPQNLHFVGPLTDASLRSHAPFPWERLDGRPLIYASLGSVLGNKADVFRCIAAASAGLNAQLVISRGGNGRAQDLIDLPGAPIVVDFAPQLDLLKRAAMCVTHAGMNTTLECLAEGVPMVAIPMVNDAPGVAARMAWHGCGEVVTSATRHKVVLRQKIRSVLEDGEYRQAASLMRAAIVRAGGVGRAADVLEQIPPNKGLALPRAA
jgi:MGT family glycosyltransferase